MLFMFANELIERAIEMVDAMIHEFEGDFDTAYTYAVQTLINIYGLRK